MRYLHVKNLEKYHPSYKDRTLIWCKTYFSMINSDIEFEMLCEIDKWRFVCFVMLELQLKNPILLDESYLFKKGFDFKTRSLSKTLESLGNRIELIDTTNVTYNEKDSDENVTYIREEKSRIEENRIEKDKNKKHKYGEFKNVLLTNEELAKIQKQFGDNADKHIKNMDEAIEMKGYKYKSHYLAILNWSKRNKQTNDITMPKRKEIL